ncbi:YggT family protein [Marinihelvus fidelis]|uniref:YggT family protein n=1 Tax=Marinihelvus fidelis TaxID=2613842 RepID=A0A5N0T6W4_9GAMM|nr:YggT family protein [Marinihelvus fidelis]KAA9129556.1 YggT family protein [Marinihelvus fidelis]
MNVSGALTYLVSTLIDLYITAVMLRLLLQWVRADFYNPVCQFLVKLTNPLLVPLRRVIPAIGQLDTASVVLMLALELVSVSLVVWLAPGTASWEMVAILAIKKLLATLLWTYFFLVIIMVILSWVGARARHPAIPLVFQLTDPVLRPIRRLVPAIAGFDLSPLFALIGIRALLLLLGS